MKTRDYKNYNFSNRYNNLTLADIIQDNIIKRKERIILTKKPIQYRCLEEDFLPRMMELDPIMPNRYVWHVAEHRNNTDFELNRFSIATEGLKCEYSEYKVIFANNGLSLLKEFYPFMFEFLLSWDSHQTLNEIDLTPSRILIDSDFWRIDTHAINAEWWIDPNMKREKIVTNDTNYICTTVDIPPHALRLYKVKREVYISKLPHYLISESSIFPVSLLTPDEKVDFWLNRNKKAA